MGRSGKWSWFATWLPIFCNNLLSRVPGIRRRKPSNILLYRKSCEVWGKNPLNMKRLKQAGRGTGFMTAIRSSIPESTDNRPRVLYRCWTPDMYNKTVGQGYSFFAVLFFVVFHQNFQLLNTGKLMLGVFCKLILAIKPDKRYCLKKVSHGDKK